MTKEEYNKKILDLEIELKEQKRKLGREYAFSNNKYSIGDIIKDHKATIRIEKIQWTNSLSGPECVYWGTILKKDLTPRKDGKTDSIFQGNIEK